MNGVVKISTHIGWKELNARGVVVGIIPDYTENGKCYKDLDAWYSDNPDTDIIYVGEYELEEGTYTWTKNKWLEWVRDIVSAEIPDITDEEIYYIALNVLLKCDWQDLSAYLNDWEWYDAILEMRKE